MKKLLFIIIAIAVYTNIRGQQINQSNNRYRSYDVLEKKQVSVKGFDMNGSENGPLTHQTLERNYNNGLLNKKTAIYKIPQLRLSRHSKYFFPALYIKWSKRLTK